MSRVVVIGGGISGLVAANVAKSRGHEVVVLEPGALGGEFASGGLKYIHRTGAMESFLDSVGVAHTDYAVQGGILLSGQVEKYPACFKTMSLERGREIRADHWRKTRRCEPNDFSERSMNDPTSTNKWALRVDVNVLLDKLARPLKVRRTKVCQVESAKNRLVVEDLEDKHGLGAKYLPYDYLVMTIPLWIAQRVCDFYIPEARAMILNIFTVRPIGRDAYSKWDYVYTPYTPGNAVHRLAPIVGGYQLEVNGDADRAAQGALADAAWLFPNGYDLVDIKEGLKGHLLPLGAKIEWPRNILAVGRYATWNPRSTVDVVLDEAIEAFDKWV